ncbi:MAG TPA: type III pantothenate kinase [Gemmatimonadota bacterium]|nr:type III pantothenate kinase [Gemmatimonadota bacterium]
MILVGDIGNTETILGLRTEDGRVIRRWRVHTDARRTADEVGILLRGLLASAPEGGAPLGAARFASVVPPATRAMIEGARRYLGVPAAEFRWAPELGIRLDVDEPDHVGPDRVANTLAVHLEYPGPAVVVDMGTATNFDVVSAEGVFLGGLIAPGIESGAATLTGRTALLPRIAAGFPESLIGKTTVEHMQIGVYRAACVLIDGLLARLRAEWEPAATAVATGGLAALVGERCEGIDVIDPDLTLKGVGWGHDRLSPPTA